MTWQHILDGKLLCFSCTYTRNYWTTHLQCKSLTLAMRSIDSSWLTAARLMLVFSMETGEICETHYRTTSLETHCSVIFFWGACYWHLLIMKHTSVEYVVTLPNLQFQICFPSTTTTLWFHWQDFKSQATVNSGHQGQGWSMASDFGHSQHSGRRLSSLLVSLFPMCISYVYIYM